MKNSKPSFDREKILLKYKQVGWHKSPIWIRQVNFLITGWPTLNTASVVPGQNIPATWSFYSILQNAKTAKTEIFVDSINASIYISQPAPLKQNGIYQDTGPVNALIASPPFGGTANQLYHFGTKTLRIEVTPDNQADLFASYNELNVVPENVGPGWWEWDDPSTTPDPSATVAPAIPLVSRDFSSIINHAFTLSGKIINKGQSQNNTMYGSLVLYETSGEGRAIPLEEQVFMIGPGAQQAVVFNPIKKNWGWIIPGIWVENPSEPQSKRFSYEIVFTLFDSFGNIYPPVNSAKVNINVTVTDHKRAYGNGAMGVLAAGLILAIFSFGAGLSAATAIAAGLGTRAQDPPEPDGLYKQTCELNLVDLIGDNTNEKKIANISKMLNSMYHALIVLDHLAITYNRWLSANMVEDSKAAGLQLTAFKESEKLLQSTIRKVTAHIQATLNEMKSDPRFNWEKLRQKILLIQYQGLHSESAQQLISAGYSKDELTAFIKNINYPQMVELSQDINQVFTLLAICFGKIGSAVSSEKNKLRRVRRK